MSQNIHTIDRTGADGTVLGNSAHAIPTDKYTKLKFQAATQLATFVGPKLDVNGIDITSITWPAQFVLEGPFTAATFASGTVVAYKE